MRWPLLLIALVSCGGAAASAPPPKPPPAPRCAATHVARAPAPHAVAMTPKELLKALFTKPHADPSWFRAGFLQAVPVAEIDALTHQLLSSFGAFQAVRPTPNPRVFHVVLQRGVVRATIGLKQGQIETLFVNPGTTSATTLEQATRGLAALPGKVAFTVRAGGKTLAQHNENQALAVGSSFKLAVLLELRNRIEKKHAWTWKRVVTLDPSWRSLPTGILQTWPKRAPLTVQTLASLMISQSDNTAADTLIHLLGRASLEKYVGQHGPFPTTGELFRLKAKGNQALLARFRKANPAQRKKLLARVDDLPLPKAADYPNDVRALDVEWLFSTAKLCDLMAKVHDLPLTGINPGVAHRSTWDKVAYKGGSEPGVINMTTWVQKGAKSYCVSATWNDSQPLKETRFAFAYGGVLAFLAHHLP